LLKQSGHTSSDIFDELASLTSGFDVFFGEF
jgi:hypothetical protein